MNAMSAARSTTADQRRRRDSLLLEFIPLGAAMLLLLFFVVIAAPPGGEDGETWIGTLIDRAPAPLDAFLGIAVFLVSCVMTVALLVFFVSGIGWMTAGHTILGLLILVARGYVTLGAVAGLLSSSGDAPSGLTLVMFAVASIAMAACSVLALALVTRTRASAS
jgi:hypothetical protein